MTKKRSRRGKKDNRSYKRLIQIKTNSNGWTTVELLGFKNGKIVVRMPDGQTVYRHLRQVKYGVAQRVEKKGSSENKDGKKYKNSKYKHKISKGKRKDKKSFKFKKRGKDELNIRIS